MRAGGSFRLVTCSRAVEFLPSNFLNERNT